MKYLLRTAAILTLLSVGAVAGYWFAGKQEQSRNLALDMAEMNYYGSFRAIQMAEGTDATLEDAIRLHLSLIEQRKARNSPMFTEKIAATDSALEYTRLSLLAKKRGATQEAQQLIKQALSFCAVVGWKDCEEANLIEAVQQLDKQGLFGGGAK